MNRPTHVARWIAAGVSVVALTSAGAAVATTEPPDSAPSTGDTMTGDTTGDTTMGSDAGTGAGPSDCPAITEGAATSSAEGSTAEGSTADGSAAADTAMATETTGAMDTSADTGAMDTSAADSSMATTGDSAVVDVSAAPMEGPVVQIVETDEYGPILADGNCMALYVFTNDVDGESTCVDECAVNWPPLFVTGGEVPPLADELDPTLFSVVEHPDGQMLKIGDWPLYYFAGDMAPGDINGQGVGGVWFLVAPDGTLVQEDEGGATTMAAEGSTAGSEAEASAPGTTQG